MNAASQIKLKMTVSRELKEKFIIHKFNLNFMEIDKLMQQIN